MVALVPARAGSKRIPGKNTRALGGVPLLAWTIAAARESQVFCDVVVSTDDHRTRDIAYLRGAHGMYRNDECSSGDDSPDIRWVTDYFSRVRHDQPDAFAILRPTSPFRTAATIRRAYEQFCRVPDVHSLRAVEPVKQHPGKMWFCNGPGYPLTPVCDAKRSDGTPWHSSPTQTLPPAYVQNASLEMAWSYVVTNLGSISGKKIQPFFTQGYEGFDINDEADWTEAERLVAEGRVALPALGAQTPAAPSL